MDRPSRATFRERINKMINELREKIINGVIENGSFLPSIQQLSKDYNLSINSIQKGLDVLEAEKCIERIPRVGIKVINNHITTITTINVGYYPSLMDEIDIHMLINIFHEQNTDIKVNLVQLEYNNYYETVQQYFINELLDIVTINPNNFLEFVERYSDLNVIFEPLEQVEGQYSYLQNVFNVGQNNYARPVTFSPVILCYNKQHFIENKVPEPESDWTWSYFSQCLDLLDQSDKIKLPFYFYPTTLNRWPLFLLQSGADFTHGINWSSKQVEKSIETCFNMIHRKKAFPLLLSENDVGVLKLFSEQKISAMITSYFSLNHLHDLTFSYDLAPLPYVNTPATLLLSIGLVINKKTKNKAGAKRLLDFFSSYETQLHIRKHTTSIPALVEAAEWRGDTKRFQPSNYYLYKELSSHYHLLSDLNVSLNNIEPIVSALNTYWMGINSKEETMHTLRNL